MSIGVFFGGKSPEHDVSIVTGQLVISELKKNGQKVVPVYLDKDGNWFCDEKLGTLKFFQEDDKEERLKDLGRIYLDMENSRGKIVLKRKGLLNAASYEIDIAFPAFHGSNGEDGTIQGMFELLGVPYVGCDVASSALTFDKILTKHIYLSHNIPTTKFLFFSRSDWESSKEEKLRNIKETLNFPIFVKPPKLGSSIGITKARDEKELELGIDVAFHYGERCLVEEGVEDLMDVTCCLIGNQSPEASLLQESVFSSELFNFEEKYLKEGGAQLGNSQSGVVIPARLDDETTEKVQAMAKEIYVLMGCGGIARVDFLYNKRTKELFANEINPLPGTVYHHLWKASGLELGDLLNKLLGYAKEALAKKEKITYSFTSDLLAQAKSIKLQMKK